MLVHHMQLVVDYLEGKIDIYNGQHNKTIERWNEVWSEMLYMGYNPKSANSIKKYIQEQLI